jgi:transcriptional regulator NrdR family protein
MLKCPKCKEATIIIDSRDNGERIRRRHKCRGCSFRFTTHEMIEDQEIEKERNAARVRAYRKKYSADERSDQEIIEGLNEAELRSPEDLIHLAVYIMGLVK